jgi:DNA repair protein RecN (Recombination protein N)
MLLSLYIQNYALISNLEINFHSGFSTITGETGAGKSILMGALSLILGQRAETGALKDKTKKCIIEGRFDIQNYSLKNYFKEHELDYEAITIFRREISIDGKSRAFINDTPVNISVLKEIGTQLVDIHSQHQNFILSDNNFQMQVVDIYAKHSDLLLKYKEVYFAYRLLQSQYQELKEKVAKAKTDLDYFQFQFDQLSDAKLMDGEQAELEQELKILTNADEIKINLEKAVFLFKEKEDNIISLLKESFTSLNNVGKFRADAAELAKRVESSIIEIKDIANDAEKISTDIDNNPSRIDIINERLDIIYSLLQKHHVSTCSELISIRNDFENRILEITSFDNEIEKTEKQINKLLSELKTHAQTLSKNRSKALPGIETDIVSLLRLLGMPHAAFKIQFSQLEEVSPTGFDKILFTFSANKNIAVEDISKVASGGEMSRLMLSIKSLISGFTHLPTIIFDEIDTGVSGEIADKMGEIMKKMAKNMQVLSITHLPQIASKGAHHFIVYKTENKDTTTTQIRLLEPKERITEIARMLSGSELTDAAISNARELLNTGK